MDKKFIYAGIPVVALFFTMILGLLSASAFGFSVHVKLFDLFDGNAFLALLFLIIPLGVAYCGFTNTFMNWAPYLMLLPFVWLLIWKGSSEGGEFLSIGAGAWIYLILSIVEIVLVLKPDLLDSVCGKKE